jgi:adenine-specific DNA-methyltransferase
LIPNNRENKIINKKEDMITTSLKMDVVEEENKHIISKNVELYIDDANNISSKLKNIDFIYMDPPYDTNRNFTLDSKSNKTGFSDKWGSNNYELWLSKLVSNLKSSLSNKGTLVIHISSENSFIIEKVLRERFKNIEKIYWKRCHGKNTVKNKFGAVIDILFVAYDTKRIFNEVRIPIEKNSIWAFKNKDEVGNYSMGALKHDRTRKGHMYIIMNDGKEYKSEYGWKLSKEVVAKMISENRIHFVPKSNNMYIKVYQHEHKGKPLSNFWDDIHSITRTNKDPRLYPTQKPQKLLERLINIFTNPDSLILDPVCGSGTTGFIADKLNRKCMLIDMNKEVLPIIKKRFKDKKYNI